MLIDDMDEFYRSSNGSGIPPHGKIWRYIDFAKFVSLLDERALFFMRADKLLKLDPYEGYFDDMKTFVQQKNMDKETREYHEQLKEESRNKDPTELYVNCWHLNEVDSDAMWKIYATKDRGIAIQSSFWRLEECLKSSTYHSYEISKIKYVDHEEENIIYRNVFERFLIKSISYQHENELRALIHETSYTHLGGFYVNVDLNKLIEKIFVSPMAPEWFFDLVKSLARQYGINESLIVKSKLYQPPTFNKSKSDNQ
jgi:hypothetical protein